MKFITLTLSEQPRHHLYDERTNTPFFVPKLEPNITFLANRDRECAKELRFAGKNISLSLTIRGGSQWAGQMMREEAWVAQTILIASLKHTE